MAAAPPMADAKELTTVTPICTVAKNRSGSFFNRAIAAAHFVPFSKRASMRLLRMAIIAISAAAKKPFARIKMNMKTGSSQIVWGIMNSVSYFSPALRPEKTAAIFAVLTNGFDVGGPSLGTAPGHPSNFSSPTTKDKAHVYFPAIGIRRAQIVCNSNNTQALLNIRSGVYDFCTFEVGWRLETRVVEKRNEQSTLQGTISRITYQHPDTHYTVARIEIDGASGVTIVGVVFPVSEGEEIKVTGFWKTHPRYGLQFQVDHWEKVDPATIEGIEKYLGSGLIKGIGPTYAKRLVSAFGLETLRVLSEEPLRILEVDGIGEVRARRIMHAWQEQRGMQDVMVFLQGHGVGAALSLRIFRALGS